jgi:hypothetical protein
MPVQIRTQQFIRSVKYVPGGIQTIELPRMADIESLILDLVGTFTYPAGATGSLTSLGPQALISRVEVVVDGKTTVVSVPGWAIGVASDRTFEGSGGGAYLSMTTPAASTAGSLNTQMYLDFMQFDGVKPKETNLRVRNASIVELKVTFAPWATAFSNAASVPSVYDITLFVDGNFCTELNPESSGPSMVVRRMSQIVAADTSNTAHQIRLPSGNILRSVKFYTHINGIASDNVVTSVNASNSLDTRVQADIRALRARQRGYKAPQVGHFEIDFARQTRGDVLVSNAWAVPSPSEPILTLGYTGSAGARIEMVTTEYIKA